MSEMSPLEMAKAILDSAGTGLHVSEIAKRAFDEGMAKGIAYDDLLQKINSALSSNVKREATLFARVANPKDKTKFRKGFYRLKRVVSKPVPTVDPEMLPTIDTGFIGRAGEYAVMSELLFLEFNVSLMSVDKGVDIVAANSKNEYFHIQVKTANQRDGAYYASVSRASFDANKNGKTFYVFVLRKDGRNDYIVMPSAQIAIYDGSVVKGVSSLGFKFSYDSKTKRYGLNGAQDASLFTNKWSLIR